MKNTFFMLLLAFSTITNAQHAKNNTDIVMLVNGISDSNTNKRNKCIEQLISLKKQDFPDEVKTIFCETFNQSSYLSKDFILLAGFIGNESCIPKLEQMAFEPEKSQRKLQWHANLALARMGNEHAIHWCLEKINQIDLNDDVVYFLLPDLVYTRNHQIFSYLIEILNSDEELCFSSDPDFEEPIICGYRVMEYLVPVIEKYPLKRLPSGDIDTKDYDKALKTVRKWFSEKQNNYKIITDTF